LSIATYSDLQASAATFLNRTDLAASIPDFIALFEARAKRELKEWLTTTITASNLTADYPLPVTVADVLAVWLNVVAAGAHNKPLHMITGEEYHSWMELDASAGMPADLVFVDYDADAPSTILRFYRPPSATGPIANLKADVVKALPALSATQTTNALLREAPDAYLFGTLAESAPYLQHDERLPIWETRAKEAMRELRILTERRRYGAQPRARLARWVF